MALLSPDDCPPPPAVRAGLPTLLLHEACEAAGGLAQLAKLLKIPPASIQRYLDGDDAVPEEVYRACAEIVLLHDGRPV